MLLTRQQESKTKGGGNQLLGKQVAVAADGTISALTGNDCFGEATGAWHEFGSIEESTLDRNDQGGHKLSVTLVELDEARKNMLINAAPYSETASTKKEELILEDGTVLESADQETYDSTRPAFIFVRRQAPVGGVENVFCFVGQLARTGNWGQKANSYGKPKIEINSIPAKGYDASAAAPSAVTWPFLADITLPTLSDAKQHGVHVFAE